MPLTRLRTLCALLLIVQAAGCDRRDIVLGELGKLSDLAGRTAPPVEPDAAIPASAVPSSSTAGHDAGVTLTVAAPGRAAAAGRSGMVESPTTSLPLSGTGGTAAAGSSAPAHASAGCGKEPMPDTSITVTGMRASYVLDLPQPYDKARAYPVIMAFRPAGSGVDGFRGALGLTAVASSSAIVVYPNCLNDAATWDVQRDSLLFDALLAKLETNYCVDRERIFAIGHAAGALFVNGLGCFRGDKLRAIAPLSSAPPPGACIGAPAAWIAQGIQDPMLGLGRANRDFWVAQNACNPRLSTPVTPTPCVEYASCDASSPVRYCEHSGDASLASFAGPGAFDFFAGL